MPVAIRSNAPSSTGTPTRKAVRVAVRWNVSRNRGANALINPHAAKQMVNESVPRRSCRLGREAVLAVSIASPRAAFRQNGRAGNRNRPSEGITAYLAAQPSDKRKIRVVAVVPEE